MPLCSMLTPTRRTKAALSCRKTCFTLVPVTSTETEKLELDTCSNLKITTNYTWEDPETTVEMNSAIRKAARMNKKGN